MQIPVFCLLIGLALAVPAINEHQEGVRQLYEQFKHDYKKSYANDEDTLRFEIFKANLERAKFYQSIEQGTATYGVTEFSDLSVEEFAQRYLNLRKPAKKRTPSPNIVYNMEAMPEQIDWREKGAVTPVENQGECGSCWAFSTIGNLESMWFIKTGKLVVLSKQQLIDCDKLDNGCKGGLMKYAFKEIKRMGGVESQRSYPYFCGEDVCSFEKRKIVAYVNDTIEFDEDENKQAAWLAENGPLSVALNAELIQFYGGGVIHPKREHCDPEKLNHAVLTVGYGVEKGIPYWLVKNSWGTRTGDKGYFKMYRGDGTCGINLMAISAIIK